jgi:hypothetical protein
LKCVQGEQRRIQLKELTMRNALFVVTAALMLFGGNSLVAQRPNPLRMNFADKGKPDVTYGRVKEITAGQKIVIDVDDAIDKSFDLSDKDLSVKLAPNLKVGDPVKISEHSVAGKTKTVQITRHSGGGVSHGDKKTAAQEKKEAK